MPTHNAVGNYGWVDAEASASHRYLLPVLLKTCEKLGARKILDLGCGNGALSGALSAAGFEIVACDADAQGIDLARKRHPHVSFHVKSVYDDPATLGIADFDAVISAEVVEHLFTPRHLPRFARTVLKPGGHLLVTTPYHGYLKNLALSITDKWDHHHNPLWDGGHIKFWSRTTLEKLLTEEGFRVMAFHGAGRVPYLWKSMVVIAQKAG